MCLYIFIICRHGGALYTRRYSVYTSCIHAYTWFVPLPPSVYFVRMWTKMCECVCSASPGGWSSGIHQPLLKCQSGLTELGKAQAAVLDFSHHLPTPSLTHTHTHTFTCTQPSHLRTHSVTPPSRLLQWAKTWWTLLFSLSIPLYLSLAVFVIVSPSAHNKKVKSLQEGINGSA